MITIAISFIAGSITTILYRKFLHEKVVEAINYFLADLGAP